MPDRRFHRYLGIDYSGAATADARLPGLRVYAVDPAFPEPREVLGPAGRWGRRELAGWLARTLTEGPPTLVGIDHGLSCPLPYFQRHGLPQVWDSFLDDFARHWPADTSGVTVRSLRAGNARCGDPRWRRPCERRTRAKSVFHFDVPGSVATSTHAGLPWIRCLRRKLGAALHCWPFDGWNPRTGRHVLAEVYPALWSAAWSREGRTPDQHDAYAVARTLAEADAAGKLAGWFDPALRPEERAAASLEGWILGVE